MKNILFLIFSLTHFIFYAQPIVHKGVFYRDDESVHSGFLASKQSEIEAQLTYLMNNGYFVNVLLMSKECPDLDQVYIGGKYYFNGPDYIHNGQGSSLWGSVDTQTYTFQFLPRQAKLYHPISPGNSFWQNTGINFDYPLLLHSNRYYCMIKESLNALCANKGLNIFPSIIDCEEGEPEEVESNISLLPKLYLNKNILEYDDFKGSQVIAKTNFCSNLFYYTPYLHTRSTDNNLIDLLSLHAPEGFILVTALPDDVAGGNVYKEVLVDLTKGQGSPGNCYPVIRELAELDRIEVLHKMHGGSNSGASSNLSNVKVGSDYLLEMLLGSANSPVPGNTNCNYGSYNGNNTFPLGNYSYIPDPIFQFHGPEISIPGSNNHVKWYNSFDGLPGGVVGECTNAAIYAQSYSINMQFRIASGCTPGTPQFKNSREDFEQTNPAGASVIVWIYYDECDDRLYYDLKIPPGFTATINPAYGIYNPDSIAFIRNSAEKIIKGILEEASSMSSYENANLNESEYPENMQNEALSAFFGVGTSCGAESPWNFGFRDGYSFNTPGLVTECAIIVWEIITGQSIPQRLWHPKPSSTCMLDMPGAAAGIIDGCLNLVDGKAWNLTGLMSAAVDYYKADANTRKEVLKSISNPLNLILGQYPQNLQCILGAECQEERIYCFTNLATNAIFDIFGKSIFSLVGNISNIGTTFDNKLKMFVPDFGDQYNVWKRSLTEGSQKKLHTFMEGVTESSKFKLAKQVTLNKIWQKFESGQLPGVSKVMLQNFFERLPTHDQIDFYSNFDKIFADEFGNIIDPNKVSAFIDDVNYKDPDQFIDVFNDFPERYFTAWDVTNASGKVFLRKNVDFLNTVGEFYDNTISQKFQDFGCSLMEEAVIRHYTGEYHSGFNMALMGDVPMTDEFHEFKNTLNQGLDKIPNYDAGPIYRGLSVAESQMADLWLEGETITYYEPKFVSTSQSLERAEDFRYGHILLIINPNISGKNIEEISKMKHEKEILFQTNKKFKVVEVRFRASDPTVKEVILEEI